MIKATALIFLIPERNICIIINIRYTLSHSPGGTRTDLALKMAEEKVFCDSCGVRPEVPKVLIVITDGKSSYSSKSMTQASKGLKVWSLISQGNRWEN